MKCMLEYISDKTIIQSFLSKLVYKVKVNWLKELTKILRCFRSHFTSFTESFQLKYTWQFTTEYLPELRQVPGLIESIVSSIDFHMVVEIA